MVTDEPAAEADQAWRQSRQPGRCATFQMAEVAVSRIMFRDILMPIARLRAPARTSVRGAGIECDKQRRQGCAMTKAKQQVLRATSGNPSILLPAALIAVRA